LLVQKQTGGFVFGLAPKQASASSSSQNKKNKLEKVRCQLLMKAHAAEARPDRGNKLVLCFKSNKTRLSGWLL
jgi:hypothetical protein